MRVLKELVVAEERDHQFIRPRLEDVEFWADLVARHVQRLPETYCQ